MPPHIHPARSQPPSAEPLSPNPGRRRFMRIMAGSAAAATVSASGMGWLPSASAPRFAYVGRAGKGANAGAIEAFAVHAGGWRHLQTLTSARPAALALHPSRRYLYAANDIETYRGLPTATVEAYRIGAGGELELLTRQPLALSAVHPRHLAVSPDGRWLAVAVTGGGAYNLLPIAPDGRLGPVAGIFKETGSGPLQPRQASAHPRTVVFAGGRLLSADLGSDRINVLNLEEAPLAASGARPPACVPASLIVAQRLAATGGSGPSQLVLHPRGHLLFVLNELNASLSTYAYDADAGRLARRDRRVRLPQAAGGGPARLAVQPAGRFLFASYSGGGGDRIAVWRITANAVLQPVQAAVNGWGAARIAALAAVTTPGGGRLFALDFQNGRVLALPLDEVTGRLDRPAVVAAVPAPLSLALS